MVNIPAQETGTLPSGKGLLYEQWSHFSLNEGEGELVRTAKQSLRTGEGQTSRPTALTPHSSLTGE